MRASIARTSSSIPLLLLSQPHGSMRAGRPSLRNLPRYPLPPPSAKLTHADAQGGGEGCGMTGARGQGELALAPVRHRGDALGCGSGPLVVTIGHSTRPLDGFLALLQVHDAR